MNYHTPVLLAEVIKYLEIKKGDRYIDATLGGGGHAEEILKRNGIVFGIDVDEDAISYCIKKFKKIRNFYYQLGNFKDILSLAALKKFDKVSGIIFDLGVSSHQIDTPEKGFSFLRDGSLDMRMDKSLNIKAKDLINVLEKRKLYEIFKNLGQENNAWIISNAIVRARRVKKIETTFDLVRIIIDIYGARSEKVSSFEKNRLCKRVFQALRIAVNSELENLKQGLDQSIKLLEKKGRIAVISFHSLEDKIVKEKFLEFEKGNFGKVLTKKPILPTDDEIGKNSRSASAKLRVFEKN